MRQPHGITPNNARQLDQRTIAEIEKIFADEYRLALTARALGSTARSHELASNVSLTPLETQVPQAEGTTGAVFHDFDLAA